MKGTDIKAECIELRKYWRVRNEQFEKWYDILSLKDELKQEGMESYVSNDPRTFYNMAMHILKPRPLVHRISVVGLDKPEMVRTSEIEEHIDGAWNRIDKQYRRRGRKPWIDEFLGILLLTGWYSIFHLATSNELIAEIWNPAEVFPVYGDEGLIGCAHIYPLSYGEANRMCKSHEWLIPRLFTTKVSLYDLWKLDNEGNVTNSIAIDDIVVKDLTIKREFDGKIPILIAPVGGLPDRGAIKKSNDDWKKTLGQSIFATNEGVYYSHNKQITYLLQLLRDTANPRWVEKTRAGNVLKEEDLFKRGAIFSITPEEDVGTLPVPPIPVELTASKRDTEAEVQRGSLPWFLYGSMLQQISGFTMSQIVAAAQQILSPYHDAVMDAVTDVDNFWLTQEMKHDLHPYGFKFPENTPKDIEMEAVYSIFIPGDIVQRATAARMLSPDIKLSQATTMDLMFPEITNPLKEIAKANADEAQAHPISRMIDLISGLEEQARFLKDMGDNSGAMLYAKSAAFLRQQITREQLQPSARREAPGAPPQAVPPDQQPGGIL